ncbi:MAG: hypothetical protein IT372_16910, partial [Polyangiaceae bacterium]|nr:hypothetical protein [Polyangiaceae bacterium]
PPANEAAGQEASFVIELAYERGTPRLGALGLRALRLPGLDVDTVKAVWHVYLPGSYEPLSWSGNLTQCSGIKYDLFRRVQWYLEEAIAVPSAWAGGDYQNILTKRRKIYDEEAKAQGDDGAALTTFPLVGERTRFRRILLGREAAELRVVYASPGLVAAARHGALLLAFGVTLWALLPGRRAPRRWLAALAALAALLVLAHHVPGIHRRVLWGADLALLLALGRAYAPWLRRAARIAIRAPWRAARAITARRLVAAAGFAWLLGLVAAHPMLLSAAALAGMSLAWWRIALSKTSKPSPGRRGGPPHSQEIQEAPHAR